MRILLLSVGLAVSLCSGCLCIHEHIDGRSKPYGATVCVCRGIAEAFVEKPEWHCGCTSEARMSHAWAAILLPVSVVCVPFEAVADTVTLPYDLLNDEKKVESRE